MHDRIDNLIIQTKPRIERPPVFNTISEACKQDFSLETLFEPHDLIDDMEVELHLGIIE